MALGINDVVLLAVSFLLVAILGPISIGIIANQTTLNYTYYWNPAVITMFQVLLPILWVIGVAIKYVPRGKG